MTGDESIAAAFAPFVASLRGGGHATPDSGWSAELIAAHVAMNSDAIAAAAALVADGVPAAYDNAATTAVEALSKFVARAGDLTGLADAVEESATQLARAHERLGPGGRATELPVRISDAGAVVVDGPMTVGALIETHAGFHLRSHREQLRALEPTRTAEPPAEFDTYELVLLWRGDDPPDLGDDDAEALQSQHLGHFTHLRRLGLLKLSGPLREQPDDRLRGISIYRTGSLETARCLAEDDPAVQAGTLRIEVMWLYTAKGALAFPLSG